MPRIKERMRCRATVVLTRDVLGNATSTTPCLAPVTRDGAANCVHGEALRKWAATYVPEVK